jgi:hypothetical protein
MQQSSPLLAIAFGSLLNTPGVDFLVFNPQLLPLAADKGIKASRRPFEAFEAEFHVFCGEGIAIVEFHPLAHLEVIRQPILVSPHLVARLGAIGLSGIGFSRASCRA